MISLTAAPDIVMDYAYLEKSFRISQPYLVELVCSYDEGCLGSSAAIYMHTYPESYTRKLLRFSARFWNRGTSEFLPDIRKEEWEWHQCHAHYHSMERFADFDLIGKSLFNPDIIGDIKQPMSKYNQACFVQGLLLKGAGPFPSVPKLAPISVPFTREHLYQN